MNNGWDEAMITKRPKLSPIQQILSFFKVSKSACFWPSGHQISKIKKYFKINIFSIWTFFLSASRTTDHVQILQTQEDNLQKTTNEKDSWKIAPENWIFIDNEYIYTYEISSFPVQTLSDYSVVFIACIRENIVFNCFREIFAYIKLKRIYVYAAEPWLKSYD